MKQEDEHENVGIIALCGSYTVEGICIGGQIIEKYGEECDQRSDGSRPYSAVYIARAGDIIAKDKLHPARLWISPGYSGEGSKVLQRQKGADGFRSC